MKVHELLINEEFCDAIVSGDRNFDIQQTNTDVCYRNGTVDIITPVMALDIFTKTWCIDTTVNDDLSFRCKDCEFSNGKKLLDKNL